MQCPTTRPFSESVHNAGMQANHTDPTTTAPSAKPLLLLVDGSSYLYRAFHAGGDWSITLPDGSRQPTGALRIMVNMLQSLAREYCQ